MWTVSDCAGYGRGYICADRHGVYYHTMSLSVKGTPRASGTGEYRRFPVVKVRDMLRSLESCAPARDLSDVAVALEAFATCTEVRHDSIACALISHGLFVHVRRNSTASLFPVTFEIARSLKDSLTFRLRALPSPDGIISAVMVAVGGEWRC